MTRRRSVLPLPADAEVRRAAHPRSPSEGAFAESSLPSTDEVIVKNIDPAIDSSSYSPSRRPRRMKSARMHVPLQLGFVYVGRGSTKFGLQASKWQNPFGIGMHGNRDEVLAKFRVHLLGCRYFMAQLKELCGQTLLCHCGPKDRCHADVIIWEYVTHVEPECASGGPTSGEDEFGVPKPRAGSGWIGSGFPLQVGRGPRRRGLQDGGGLCSPGRWAPADRRYPAAGLLYFNALDKIISEVGREHGTDYWRRLTRALACSQVSVDLCQARVEGEARDR